MSCGFSKSNPFLLFWVLLSRLAFYLRFFGQCRLVLQRQHLFMILFSNLKLWHVKKWGVMPLVSWIGSLLLWPFLLFECLFCVMSSLSTSTYHRHVFVCESQRRCISLYFICICDTGQGRVDLLNTLNIDYRGMSRSSSTINEVSFTWLKSSSRIPRSRFHSTIFCKMSIYKY